MEDTNQRARPPKFLSDLSDEEKRFLKGYLNAPVRIQRFVNMYLTAPRYLQDALQVTIDAIHAHEFTEHEREVIRKYRAITQKERDTWDKIFDIWCEGNRPNPCKVYEFKKPPKRNDAGGEK